MSVSKRLPRLSYYAGLTGIAAALALGAACDSGSDDGETSSEATGGDTVDEAAVQAKLDAFPAGFTKINDVAEQTQAHTFAMTVDVYVEDAHVDTYRSIDPDGTGSAPNFPAGATIFKQQFDAMGNPNSFTVMVKGPAGYNPAAGDWWWGFADDQSVLTTTGVLDNCITCHLARPDDDYVFGVPTDNRL